MMSFLTAGGPVMVSVLLLGMVASVLALHYARTLHRRVFALALGTTAATLLVGTLGTVLGFQKSVQALPQVAPAERWIYLLGLNESLNNLVVALVVALLVSLVLAVGAYRAHLEEDLALQPADATA